MKTSLKAAWISALSLAVVATTWWLATRPTAPGDGASGSGGATPVSAESGDQSDTSLTAAESTVETVATGVAPIADNTPEVIATRRMYLAHAPLRTPEVADPDSAANRQILETMVLKALNRSSSLPSSSPGAQ